MTERLEKIIEGYNIRTLMVEQAFIDYIEELEAEGVPGDARDRRIDKLWRRIHTIKKENKDMKKENKELKDKIGVTIPIVHGA